MREASLALLQAVREISSSADKKIYAVLDGAPFDDLPAELAAAGIAHRSLYRNVQDFELIRVGPWLVDPYHGLDRKLNIWGGMPSSVVGHSAFEVDTTEALSGAKGHEVGHTPSFHASGGLADVTKQFDRVVAIIGDIPAAVFWVGDLELTEAALWRHLRTLNMVLIPKQYVEDIPEELQLENRRDHVQVKGSDPTGQVAVLFRHADGNVLAQVLPCLDAAQFSRFFGPARETIFAAPDYPSVSSGSVVRRALLPDGAPPKNAGLLSLNANQCELIGRERMLALRRQALSAFCFPPGSTSTGEEKQISDAFDRAERYGFESKEQFWAFIEADKKYGWGFERSQQFISIRDHLEDRQLSADAKFCLFEAELDFRDRG